MYWWSHCQCSSLLPYPVNYRHKVHYVLTRTNMNNIHDVTHDELTWQMAVLHLPEPSPFKPTDDPWSLFPCCLNNWTSFSVTSCVFFCCMSCFHLDSVFSPCVGGSRLGCKSRGLFLMGAVCLCNTRLPFVLVTDKITKENHSGRGRERERGGEAARG